jgi:hypothetical protein
VYGPIGLWVSFSSYSYVYSLCFYLQVLVLLPGRSEFALYRYESLPGDISGTICSATRRLLFGGVDRDFLDRGGHFHLECLLRARPLNLLIKPHAKPEATRVRNIVALQALNGVGALAVFISPALCVRKGSSSSAF